MRFTAYLFTFSSSQVYTTFIYCFKIDRLVSLNRCYAGIVQKYFH